MTSTTSLKLSDELKSTINQVAAREGKTAHALMVETLQDAMDRATLRDELYAHAQQAYDEAVATNTVFDMADVHAHIRRRVAGKTGPAPKARRLDPTKPMVRR